MASTAEILIVCPQLVANMGHHAKFHQNGSKGCVRNLGFVEYVFGPLAMRTQLSLVLCKIWLESTQWFR